MPSLTAIALWGQGDTWGGGGMFTSNSSYWLNADANTFRIRDDTALRRDSKRPVQSRMERSGWIPKRKDSRCAVFEKSIPKSWVLRRIVRSGKSEQYELEQPEDHCTLVFPEWEWAEWDGRRLVWAEGGYLRAALLGPDKLDRVRTLYDFNGMDPTQAPAK